MPAYYGKAWSLREPWASLVAYGPKRIETRSWPTRYRGPLYIHASQKKMPQADPHVRKLLELLPGREPAYGLVLCKCVLTDCRPMDEEFLRSLRDPVERLCGEYAPGRWAWLLEQVEPLAEPFSAKGRLGLWTLELPPSDR